MLKMVDGTGIIGVDMVCPLGGAVSPPQPPNYDNVEMEGVGSLVLPNSLKAPIERLELTGNSVQGENPAPDNPQEIKSAGRFDEASGKYLLDVKVTGKNLAPHVLDFMKFGNNDPKTIEFDEKTNSYKLEMRSDNFNQVTCYIKFKLKKGTYAIRRKIKIEGVDIANPDGLRIINSDTKEVLHHAVFGISRVFELPKDTNVAINIGHMSNKKQTEAIIYDLQLECGDKTTEYEPYTEQSMQIALDEPLRGIGEYKDMLTNDGVVRRILEVPVAKYLSPIEGDAGDRYVSAKVPNANINYDPGRCMSNVGFADFAEKKKYVPCPYQKDFLIRIADDDTIDMVKEKTKDVIVAYTTKEPVIEPLPESVQAQLSALHTENGTTHVFVDSGEIPCGIKLTYRKEK